MTIRTPIPADVEADLQAFLDIPLAEHFERAVERFGDRDALVFEDQRVSYRSLNAAVNQLAGALAAQVFPEQKQQVGILLPFGVAPVVAMLAAIKAGKAYVMLDPGFPEKRLRAVVEHAEIGVLMTDQAHLELAGVLADGEVAVVGIDEPRESAAAGLGVYPNGKDLFAIYYTSGSSGKPKGVMVNHEEMLFRLWLMQAEKSKFVPGQPVGLLHTLTFGSSRAKVLSPLMSGATLHMYDLKRRGLNGLAEWIEDQGIEYIAMPVNLFREFVKMIGPDRQFPTLRVVNMGGQSIFRADVEAFRQLCAPGAVLSHGFSATEIGNITRNYITHDTPLDSEVIPAGRLVTGKQIRLLDEFGQAVEPGEIGEIVALSRYFCSGYWRDPSLTDSKFKPVEGSDETIYHTGDLGRFRDDGMLEHHGRKDFQIKLRGYRVERLEIEAALHRVAGIQQAAVTVQTDGQGNNQLVAFLVPSGWPAPDTEEVRQGLADNLPDYMIPHFFVYLDQLPLTTSGKIDRRNLPDLELDELPRQTPVAPPQDALEEQLVEAWEEVLGIHPIGVEDNFFSLGGDSLLAMRLFVQIERKIGVRLPLALLLQAGSVGEQAAILRREGWEPNWSALVTLRAEGSRPPLFFAAPAGGNVLTYRDLVNRLSEDQPCYALQSLGMGGDYKPLASIQDIARHNIEEIKRVQSEGPYMVGGSSLGGKVAYEMAQQLHDGGDEVSLLVMIDNSGPNYRKNKPGVGWRRRKALNQVRNVQKHVENLWLLPWRRKWEYVSDRGRRVGRRLRRAVVGRYQAWRYPTPHALKEVERANRRAKYKYEAPRHTARIVFFRASQQPLWAEEDPTSGWGPLLGERVEIHTVPGNHTTLIYEPRVEVLAGILEQALQETFIQS